MPAIDDEVLRLQVAVHDAAPVQMPHRVSSLPPRPVTPTRPDNPPRMPVTMAVRD
jgi:hypothetical protein